MRPIRDFSRAEGRAGKRGTTWIVPFDDRLALAQPTGFNGSERTTVTFRATMLYEGDIGGVRHAEGSAMTRAGALAVAEREVPPGTHVVGVIVADDDTRFESRRD